MATPRWIRYTVTTLALIGITHMWPWVIPALKGIGGSILAGITTGAGRRAETFTAGKHAVRDVAGGSGAQMAAYSTQQDKSQGQQHAFQTQQAGLSRAANIQSQAAYQTRQIQADLSKQLLQHRHEKAMLSAELSANGQSAGQIPWYTQYSAPPGPGQNKPKPLFAKPPIGETRSGRPPGSTREYWGMR